MGVGARPSEEKRRRQGGTAENEEGTAGGRGESSRNAEEKEEGNWIISVVGRESEGAGKRGGGRKSWLGGRN